MPEINAKTVKVLADGQVVELPRDVITIRGQFLTWKVNALYYKPAVLKKRGAVSIFSRSSRFRIMSYMASLEWEKCYPALFLTLTYPDLDHIPGTKERNVHRATFWRSLENHIGLHTCGLWRVEWKIRASGVWKGSPYPHFHIMVFSVPWINYLDVNRLWSKAIGYNAYCRTEVRRIKNEKQAGYYTSKYTSKVPDDSLVIASYLSKNPGRHWGILRKDLLPLHPERVSANPECRRLNLARDIALQGRPQINEWGNESFKLLGPLAVVVAGVIFDGTLDEFLE